MATGILGTPTDLSADTDTTLYTVPSSTFAVVTVSICNRTNNAVAVRVGISTAASPSNAEWIEYDTHISARGVLERTGIVIEAGKRVVVRSNAISVNAMVFGIETSTV